MATTATQPEFTHLRYPPSTRDAVIRGVVGALLIAGAIACIVGGSGFPYNAPVESFMNFGIAVTLFGGGGALIVASAFAGNRPSRPIRATGPGTFAILALCLVGFSFLLWAIAGISPFVSNLGDFSQMRYMYLAGPSFWLGLPWVVGTVFGAIGLRKPAATSQLLCWIAIALGLVLVIPAVGAATLYGMGLTA